MGLKNLQKLQLDNNHIRKIENLDHLLNLTWLGTHRHTDSEHSLLLLNPNPDPPPPLPALPTVTPRALPADLSFNQIEKIEGLEPLVKITDLCLTHNKVSKIEGITTLVELEIFSMANNEIVSTDELTQLREFPKLRVVNFQNNPVTNDAEYQPVLLAFLKYLKYLDFRLVDEQKVRLAKDQYFSDLQALQQEEAEEEKKKASEAGDKKKDARHLKANMPGVEKMLDNILAEDMEGEKLKLFSDFEEALDDFKDEFGDAWEKYEKQMHELYDLKEAEVAKFHKMYHGAIEAVDQKSKDAVTDFKLCKKNTKQKLQTPEFKDRAVDLVEKDKRDLMKEMRSRSETLKESLLNLEIFQIEQYEDLIEQFEEKYGSIRSNTLDACRLFFEKMRDLQGAYFEKVKEKAGELLTKFQSGENMNLRDEALQVLADKDAFMTGVVTGSHEFRLSKIDAKDEELAKREVENYEKVTSTIQEAEKERSRTRTDDVMSMTKFFEREIDEMAAEM